MPSYADMFAYQLTASPGEITYGYRAKAGAPLSRVVVPEDGAVERLVWDPSSRAWKTFYSAPRDVCDAYARCGPFGLCNVDAASTSFCGCAEGFRPASPAAWRMREASGGCRRAVPLDCGGNGTTTTTTTTDSFVVVRSVKLPDTQNASVDTGIAVEECRERCLTDCSCVAYAAADIRGGGGAGSGCIIWTHDVVNIRYVDKGQDLYLRLAKSELEDDARDNKRKRNAVIAAISAVCAVAAIFAALAFIICRNMRNKTWCLARASRYNGVADMEANKPLDAAAIVSVDLATVEKATRNFSKRNVIGEGLPGRKVAVKRLKVSSLPNRALDDFMREVAVMSKLRHDNLVRLLAFSDQANERVMVYEYMQNRSLNLYIFDIADFGTEKQFRADQTGTQTVVVSPGYAPPECAKDGDVTLKCDVFSFGVVLLEVVSGRRNSAEPSLVSHAWKLWEESRIMDLHDAAVPRPRADADLVSELRRCIQIGLLCVQRSPCDRPAMSAVLAMLTSRTSQLDQPRTPVIERGTERPLAAGEATGGGAIAQDPSSTVVNLM
ncbi:hypothetical protein GQ55_7G297600 [Panicum hallii var. hallii]|uniref:Protein kinase domain-containing protein n=1 Tax=Panicum hallii var. hallii TaxID=1504633 RepID=A0A2T7D0F4_9POAL|nr:hypothetical protein GQ55_7G297600 [Panicum hallii var. hallii]